MTSESTHKQKTQMPALRYFIKQLTENLKNEPVLFILHIYIPLLHLDVPYSNFLVNKFVGKK